MNQNQTIDFVELYNSLLKTLRPDDEGVIFATSLDDTFEQLKSDSLDVMMIILYICEAYGVSEEVARTFIPSSIKDIQDFILANKTKNPESIEDILNNLK